MSAYPLSVPVAATLAGTLYGVWYLTQPGRSFETAAADVGAVVTGTLRLTPAQDQIRQLIEREFAAAGLAKLGIAAVVNAYAESRLNPLAIGDGGASVGLFQLHENGGGAGMSTSARQDPTQNTRRAIALARAEQWPPGLTHAELASRFANRVERCAACGYQAGSSQLTYRAGLVAQLYGAELARTVPA